VTEWKLGKWEYLVIINIIFFLAGTFFEPPVLMALLVPLLGLLGATVAFRTGFDPVLAKFKIFERGALRVTAAALRAIATVLFLGPIWFFCLFGPNFDISRGYIARSAARSAEAIGVPMVWFTIALPIAITVIFIHLLADFGGRRTAEQH